MIKEITIGGSGVERALSKAEIGDKIRRCEVHDVNVNCKVVQCAAASGRVNIETKDNITSEQESLIKDRIINMLGAAITIFGGDILFEPLKIEYLINSVSTDFQVSNMQLIRQSRYYRIDERLSIGRNVSDAIAIKKPSSR